jgi:hypothetical protein
LLCLVIGGIIILVIGGVIIAWMVNALAALRYDDSEERRQGTVIFNKLKAKKNAKMYWMPVKGRVTILICEVTASEAQQEIADLVREMKAHGEITCAVHIQFYERENWIEWPKNDRGISGGERGPEKLIRSMEL